MVTIEERANKHYPKQKEFKATYRDGLLDGKREGYIKGATEQKTIDKEEAHKAFVELLAVQYGEDCDESMHQYIDDVLKKYMEE